MRHSASGSMTESYKAKVAIPCERNGESVLQKLYIDLCNLIVESRIPGLNDRGYGDGVHCPPLLGSNEHICDLSKPECQKHQTIIHHLLQKIASNIFEIEVILLPECCTESKLKERIQNNEYVLLERWSMNFTYGKVGSNIEIPQLLRAVRSFLHFSQISAWLSSTNGKSPANICYWVNPKLEALCTKFKHEPELHSFPICKIDEDLSGCVKVEFPARTQYIPLIPCSKHPPLCRYSLRGLNEDSDLCQNISLNPQIVRQLHKTCNTEQSKVTAVNYGPETTTLMLDPETLLKSFSTAMPDGSRTNRVLKHSNSQDNLLSSSILPLDLKGKTMDIIPKKSSTYVCNYAETISLGLSQENLCCDKRRLVRHLRKSDLKLKKIKKGASVPLPSKNPIPILSSDVYKLNQNTMNLSVNNSDVSQVSNLLYSVASSEKSLRRCIESSPVNLEKYPFPSSQTICRQLTKRTKAVKRKDSDINAETICVLPRKRKCCDINLPIEVFKYPSPENCTTSLLHSSHTSQVKDIVNDLRTDGEVSKDDCSCLPVRPGSSSNFTKICKEKPNNSSNFSFPTQSTSDSLFSTQENDCIKISNSQIDTASNISKHDKLVIESNSGVSLFNSNIKLSKRTCISQLDENETRVKKSRLSNSCKKLLNLNIDSSCTILKSYLNKSKQKKFQISKDSDKNLPKEEYLSKRQCLKNKTLSKPSCSSTKSIVLNHKDFFTSDPTDPDESKNSNDNIMNSNISKQFSVSRSSDFKISNASRISTKQALVKVSKKKFPQSACKNLTKNNPLLKSSRKEITGKIHRAILKNQKLSALFNIRKCYRNINRKRKHEMKHFQTCLNIINKTASSQTSEKIVPSSLAMNYQNTTSTNGHPETLTEASTDLKKVISTNDLSTENNNHSVMKIDGNLTSQMISLQNDHQSSFVLNSTVPTSSRNLCQITDENLECFPNRSAKFPKERKLLVNFEESILKGRFPLVKNVKGFHAEIGASGSFCPNHLTLPADVSFYELGNPHQGTTPYVAHVTLGDSEYCLPKRGAVQVTLFNPSETVVKMFVLNYDFSSMPPLCQTFIRQKTYYLPVGLGKEYPASQKWLRFIIHLRFASSKTGRIYLHEDFKIVVLNKSNDDAASEFSQEPRELCSFLSVPMYPTFSNI